MSASDHKGMKGLGHEATEIVFHLCFFIFNA